MYEESLGGFFSAIKKGKRISYNYHPDAYQVDEVLEDNWYTHLDTMEIVVSNGMSLDAWASAG